MARKSRRASEQSSKKVVDWTTSTALMVIDVQKGFDDEEHWGPRNNPNCEANISLLLEAWRAQGWPVVFVRHDSTSPNSPLRPGTTGNQFKDVVTGDSDLLVAKSVHSAFFGEPDLHSWLREHGISSIAVCGIQTNMCCETTARMASDMGYEVLFVIDATHTFDIAAVEGKILRARELARVTALELDAEFCQVVYTTELVE